MGCRRGVMADDCAAVFDRSDAGRPAGSRIDAGIGSPRRHVTADRRVAVDRRAVVDRRVAVGRLALAAAALAIAGGFAARPVAAQGGAGDYPSRPIRFVVPYAAGGPLDQVARVLGEQLRGTLGQPVVVENKPGAGGNIGADLVAKSPPDGYAIVMGAVATHAINPYLYKTMPYDANRDFTPISRIAVVPNVLVVAPKWSAEHRIDSVKSLLDYARANPGKLNYGSGGSGSAGHLAGELFKAMGGVGMVHVPYKGAAPAKMALLGGEIELMFDNLASAAPQIRDGQLKALAVTTLERAASLPQVPTVAEAGIAGFDINTWFGIFAPAGLPSAIRDRLYQATRDALAAPAVVDTLARMGAAPAPMTPAAFTDYVQAEQRKYEPIVRQSGATAD
ncbi:MAG: Bug family tripartite tricarboxylate transporter substrate binding protein [Lautropia sp.]